jgi:polysaccharide export outer membrane protein
LTGRSEKMSDLKFASRQLICLIIFLLSVFDVSASEDYLLNPGDQLEISVWRDEALQRQVLVLPDGTISFPLVGVLPAAGKTAAELQQTIIKRLRKYIPEAEVTVSVLQPAGYRIYVIGKVTNPGAYQLSGPIDILQALSLAGGLDRFATKDKIKVLRRSGGIQKAIRFNYDEVLEGKNLESNIILLRGDTVIVP